MNMTMNAALKENMDLAARSECPIFLRKTYHMICSCDDEISKWADDGMSFYVKQVEIFSSKVLPEYFKHSNFSSFVRQLNFYGFTKDRNETILNGVKPKQSDWHFRHEDFKRDNPKLLVKIKRRLASHHSGTASRKKGSGGVGGGSVVMDAKNQKEMKKEIEGLSETMKKMESTMGKLTEMMKSIQIEPSEGATKSKSTSTKAVAGTITSSRSAVPSTKISTNTNASTAINTDVKESKRLTGSSKKQKILLNDAQLFSSNLGSISMKQQQQQQQLRTVVSASRSGRVSPVSLMVSKHEASIDLPDLGLAGTSDADLLMEDKSSSSSSSSSGKASLAKRPLRIPLSSRQGSRSGTGAGTMNTCETDINMNASLAEVDQIFTSIEESDIHMTSTISSQEQTSIIYQDRLPDLVADDTSSLSQQQQQKSDTNTRAPLPPPPPPQQHQQRFSRNILDSAALVNLEKSLALLPIQERINFVQGIMKNISGLDDLRQQGLTIVEKSKSEESNGTGTSQSLSRAEQVVKSGIDTSLLSELESLLLRVGLKILIIPTSSSLSLQSSNTNKSSGSSCANSKKKPKSNKESSSYKDSSSYEYVQIEA